MTVVKGPAQATTALLHIPGLTQRPFLGGGCCVVPAADLLRTELESWSTISDAVVDPETGEAVLTLIASDVDLTQVFAMLQDLGYPAVTAQPDVERAKRR